MWYIVAYLTLPTELSMRWLQIIYLVCILSYPNFCLNGLVLAMLLGRGTVSPNFWYSVIATVTAEILTILRRFIIGWSYPWQYGMRYFNEIMLLRRFNERFDIRRHYSGYLRYAKAVLVEERKKERIKRLTLLIVWCYHISTASPVANSHWGHVWPIRMWLPLCNLHRP